MRIGEIARICGVTDRVLRYYESRGLIHPERDSNGYRYYSARHIWQVREIREMLRAGFSTREIKEFIPCFAEEHPGGPCEEGLRRHLNKIREIDRLRSKLQRQRDYLFDRLERFHLHPQKIQLLIEEAEVDERQNSDSRFGNGYLYHRSR